MLINSEYSYPDFNLTMDAYTCALKAGEVELREHVDLTWLAVEELDQLDWAAADVPEVRTLKEIKSKMVEKPSCSSVID